mgnify:CR=1 FL=1
MSTQVRKGNKILSVSDDAVERYIKMGYSVIDSNGEIITKAIPVDNNQLKLEYTRMSEEIEKLKAENKSLKDTNDFIAQENKRLAKELVALKSTPISSEPKTSTRKRKSTTEDTTEKAE